MVCVYSSKSIKKWRGKLWTFLYISIFVLFLSCFGLLGKSRNVWLALHFKCCGNLSWKNEQVVSTRWLFTLTDTTIWECGHEIWWSSECIGGLLTTALTSVVSAQASGGISFILNLLPGGCAPNTMCWLSRLLLMLGSNVWVPVLTPRLLHLNQVTLVYLQIVRGRGGLLGLKDECAHIFFSPSFLYLVCKKLF